MKVEGVLNEITGNSLKARSKENSSIGLLFLFFSIGVNEVYEFRLLLAKNIRICRRVSNGGRMRRKLNGKWT